MKGDTIARRKLCHINALEEGKKKEEGETKSRPLIHLAGVWSFIPERKRNWKTRVEGHDKHIYYAVPKSRRMPLQSLSSPRSGFPLSKQVVGGTNEFPAVSYKLRLQSGVRRKFDKNHSKSWPQKIMRSLHPPTELEFARSASSR